MKNKLVIIAGIAAAMAVTTVQASTIITGNIGFSGNANLNTGTAATATRVDSYGIMTVGSDGGYIASITPVGTVVTFVSPWTFIPSGASVTPFWTSSLGNGLTFSLTSWNAVRGSNGGLANVDIVGTGIMSDLIGDVANNYSFHVTLQDPSGNGAQQFTFSASQAATPDGGMTVILLGAALSGLGLLRKKLIA